MLTRNWAVSKQNMRILKTTGFAGLEQQQQKPQTTRKNTTKENKTKTKRKNQVIRTLGKSKVKDSLRLNRKPIFLL